MNSHSQVGISCLTQRVRCLVFIDQFVILRAFPGASDGKESAYNAGDPSSIPGSERLPGEGHGSLLHCSCLKNSMDRGASWATVLGVTELDTTEYLSLLLYLRKSNVVVFHYFQWQNKTVTLLGSSNHVKIVASKEVFKRSVRSPFPLSQQNFH